MKCGNCKSDHESATAVRACYGQGQRELIRTEVMCADCSHGISVEVEARPGDDPVDLALDTFRDREPICDECMDERSREADIRARTQGTDGTRGGSATTHLNRATREVERTKHGNENSYRMDEATGVWFQVAARQGTVGTRKPREDDPTTYDAWEDETEANQSHDDLAEAIRLWSDRDEDGADRRRDTSWIAEGREDDRDGMVVWLAGGDSISRGQYLAQYRERFGHFPVSTRETADNVFMCRGCARTRSECGIPERACMANRVTELTSQ